ncbi:MAG: pilus assembly protein TadG-related protein [Stellaceae bacterium]
MRGKSRSWRGIAADRGGAISIIGALVLVPVVGVSALALEYGHGLLQKTEDQRAADLAAFGGALVYGSTSSSTSATGAAANIAALNGIASGGASASVIGSPTGDGNSAVKVTVTTDVPLMLARVLTTSTTLPVSATGYAEIKSSAPACIIALSGTGTGVTMTGGTSVTASGCAVASNNSFTLNGSAALVTQNVDYGKAAPSVSGGAAISAPTGKTLHKNKVTTTDPLSPSSGSPGSTEVTNAVAHLGFNSSGGCAGTAGTVCAIASPGAPTVTSAPTGGTALSFAYSTVPASALPANCADSYASSTHTVTCTGTGPFNIGSITVGGGLTVNFNKTGSTSAVYNFGSSITNSSGDTMGFGPGTFNVNGSITNSSGTMSFGAGTFRVNGAITNSSGSMTFGAGTFTATGGIATGGGTTTTFGAGTFNIGKSTASCNSSSGYSICNTGTSLTFAGPSTFVLSGGIYNSGGETLTMGSAGTTTNSYDIGAANDGNSIAAGGGAATTLYDATGTGDLFETAGSIINGGSSSACLTIPAAAAHDIDGYVSLSCGATLGAGVYTVTGYFALGGNGGGGTVSGSNVTLVIGGASVPSSGSCSGLAFCIANGFSTVTLTAPSSGGAENLVVVGPATGSAHSSAGASFTEGSTNTTLSGAFYFPNGAVSMSGAATVNTAGGCLELIGSQVSLSGGSAATSTCTGLTGSSLGTAVFLVQ